MGSDGGASLAVGVWFQSIGAIKYLVDEWKFGGAGGIYRGESTFLTPDSNAILKTEYFDMDAAISSSSGMKFIQFKVTTQLTPKPFYFEEFKKIFLNAAQAILKHQKTSPAEPITVFIVATNREIGDLFAHLQKILKNLESKKAESDFKDQFAKTLLPEAFFPKKKAESAKDAVEAKEDSSDDIDEDIPTTIVSDDPSTYNPKHTIHKLASNIVRGKGKDWGVTQKECVEACLTALRIFYFAKTIPATLRKQLDDWFKTWGFLSNEYNQFYWSSLGIISSDALDGSSRHLFDLIRLAIDESDAIPITPSNVWKDVIQNLKDRNELDGPTTHLITKSGFANWMIDRSDLLKGLPEKFDFEIPTILDEESPDYFYEAENPQIFALVGPGGVGKTGLLAKLLSMVATRVWNWEKDQFLFNDRFIGYPINTLAEHNLISSIEGAVRNWGKRTLFSDRPVERFTVAADVKGNDPTVWLGLDGIDEFEQSQLGALAKTISACVDSHPNIRIILTCRPAQFRFISSTLKFKGKMKLLDVNEFEVKEAWEALSKATDREIETPFHLFMPVGGTKVIATTEFESSILQPLFIGVLHNFYKKSGNAEIIQKALEGDDIALQEISREYIYIFCERLHRRLSVDNLTETKIFKAIKKLATKVTEPQNASIKDWQEICSTELYGMVDWGKLYLQFAASGLIKEIGNPGNFEWRHLFIGRHLPSMEVNPKW